MPEDNKEVIDTSAFSMDEGPPPSIPEPPAVKTALQEPKKDVGPVLLPITDEDRERYFNSVLSNKPYTETLQACNKRLEVGFRTRSVQESEAIIQMLNKALSAKTIDYLADYQNKHLMCHIACAVTSINDENIDKGSLDERLKRIEALNSQIYMIIIELINRFDDKMNRLREEALKPNF